MATVLFESGDHRCVVFNGLVRGDDGIQANQFLIQHGHHSAVIDPGGALVYTPLMLALGSYVPPHEIDLVLCSHQDPDIIGSVDKWLLYSQARIVCSRLWGRFVPHVVPGYMQNAGKDRYVLAGDRGGEIALGECSVRVLPAHFMHSVGNLSFYDVESRILFSGDIGAALIPSGDPYHFVEDLEQILPKMTGFHRRYMASNRATRLWVKMVRQLDPAMIVPQHGLPMQGKVIGQFLSWLEDLQCGVDLLTEADYQPFTDEKIA
ncbi:MAG: FprA family A-type flavoprotein [Proteobacteria bacterium]|nr:FprA family A-type flavoprotein [Pseudomonadota bacterium]